jgi:hypothetical protein
MPVEVVYCHFNSIQKENKTQHGLFSFQTEMTTKSLAHIWFLLTDQSNEKNNISYIFFDRQKTKYDQACS